MTPQPRGPVRAGIPADAIQHAQSLEEERLLIALRLYGPLKFRKLARLGLPGCGDALVQAAVDRLVKAKAVASTRAHPVAFAITTLGRERLYVAPPVERAS